MLAAGLLLGAGAAQAQVMQSSQWDVELGIGAAYEPEYMGSDSYSFGFLPVVNIEYDRTVFIHTGDMDGIDDFDGVAVGANAIDDGNLKVFGGLHYRFGQPDDPGPLQGLSTTDDTLEIFAGAEYAVDFFKVDATLYQGLDLLNTNAHDGLLLDVGMAVGARLSQEFDVLGRLGLTWGSSNYMNNHYSVSAAELTANQSATGRNQLGSTPFSASDSFQDVSLSVVANYRFTDNFSIRGLFEASRLLDNAASSPIVANGGQPGQLFVGALVIYSF